MHYVLVLPVINSPFAPELRNVFTLLIATIVLWTLFLKAFSLWYAARGGQKWWFIFLLIINTAGILEIIYLIWFRPPSTKDTSEKETPVQHSSVQA